MATRTSYSLAGPITPDAQPILVLRSEHGLPPLTSYWASQETVQRDRWYSGEMFGRCFRAMDNDNSVLLRGRFLWGIFATALLGDFYAAGGMGCFGRSGALSRDHAG